MEGKNRIFGGRETVFLAVNVLTFRFFTRLSLVYPKISGTGAALSSILTGAAAVLLVWLVCRADCDLISAAERTMGRTGKYAAAAVLLIYLAVSAVFSLRESAVFAAQVAFPSAPMWYVLLPFAAAMYFGAVRGLAAIARTHLVIIPFVLLLTVIMLASVLVHADFANLLPILGSGGGAVVKNAAEGLAMYADLIMLCLLAPMCESSETFRRFAVGGAAAAAVLNAVFVLAYSAAIPYPMSAQVKYPLYVLLKEVYCGRFLQRIDAVYMLVTALGEMLFSALVLFEMTYVIKRAFGTAGDRVFALPLASAAFLCAIGVTSGFEDMLGRILFFGSLAAVLIFAALIGASAAVGRRTHERN